MFTRNGWTVVGLASSTLVAGVVLGYHELVALSVVFILCLALAGLWLLFRPQLDVERRLQPSRISEGEGAAGVLTIRNIGSRRCPPVLAVEAFANGAVSIPLPGVGADATHLATYRLPANRRGCYAVGPLQIRLSDPFRLVSYARSYGGESTLWVHPRIHDIPPIPTGRTQDLEGSRTISAPQGGITFHSLREYEPGDDPRLIHWRSTARIGTLMVRHTVVTNEPSVMIVLDTSAGPYNDDSFDDAVRVAASLIQAAIERKFPIEFRTTGGLSASIDTVGQGRTDVLDKLASVETTPSDPGLRALIGFTSRRQQGVALGVVTGQAASEQLNAVGSMRSRFEAVSLAELGEQFERPATHLRGVLSINAKTSDEFERAWKMRVR